LIFHPALVSVSLHALLFADLCVVVMKNNKCVVSKFLLAVSFYYLFLIVVFRVSDLSFFDMFLACYILKDVNLTKFVLYKLAVEIAFFLLLFYGLITGSVTDEARQLAYKGGSGYYHTLGFWNTNNTSSAFWNLIVSLYFLGRRFGNFFLYLLGAVISVVVFRYTLSRTFFLMECLLFFLGLAFWWKKSDRLALKARPLLLSMPFLLTALLLLFIAIIRNPKYGAVGTALNVLFSYRFGYFSEAAGLLTPVNILFGFKIPEEITVNGYTKELIVDQSYLRLVFSGGLVTLFIFFSFFVKFMRRENITRNKALIPIVVATAAGGFVEAIFCYFDTTALIFWLSLYKGSRTGKTR